MCKISNNKKILIMSIICISIFNSQCSPKTYSILDYEKMSIFEYLKLPDEQLNIKIAALILSKEVFPDIKFIKYFQKIEKIASRVDQYVGNKTDPHFKIASINSVLYKEFGLEFDKEDFNGQKYYNHFFSSTLDRRKGVCTTMPLIYMIVAEELNYPISAVSAPSHVFCRWIGNKGNNKFLNIEATGNGSEIPDVSYIDEMKISKKTYKNGVYLKTLSKREYIGLLLHNNAAFYMESNQDDKAVKYLEESIKQNKLNSFGYYVLAICYKKLSQKTTDEKVIKKYLEKYEKNMAEVEKLGIAPPCPPDYWKEQVSPGPKRKDGENLIIKKDANGLNYYEDASFKDKIQKLELKYSEYFK